MKALFNCAFADPWIEVAKRLQARSGIEPIYWIGYADDDSDRLIGKEFPKAVYHPYFDAWKGVFPTGFEADSWGSVPEPEEYNRYAEHELQALDLMGRMDFDQHTFNYAERRLLFRKFIRCWTHVIERLGIDVMISPSVPHRSFDFPLYLVCRNRGIRMVSFLSTPFSSAGRIIPLTEPYRIPERIRREFERKKDPCSPEQMAADMRDSLARIRQDYESARPETLREHSRHHRGSPSVVLTGRKFASDVMRRRSPWLGKAGWLLKGVPSYHVERGRDVEASRSRQGLASYSVKILRRIRHLTRLEAEYRKVIVQPDLEKKFVLMALHYQPEATTAPRAGLFVDQLYVLELLSKHLPREWSVYVKENPLQFNPIAEGNTARPARFYRDALKIPRVSFIAADTDPFTLIDRSLAVFTIAGTIGWEGMVRGKPVVCFGPSWYEHYSPGVLRIRREDDLKGIPGFISGYRFDEAALCRYLRTIEENSIRAYFRRGLKKAVRIGEEECVNALQESVSRELELSGHSR